GFRFAADWDGRFHPGYGLAFLLFVWAGMLHLRRLVRRRQRSRARGRPPQALVVIERAFAGLVGGILGVVSGALITSSIPPHERARVGGLLGLAVGAPSGVLLLRHWENPRSLDEPEDDSGSSAAPGTASSD